MNTTDPQIHNNPASLESGPYTVANLVKALLATAPNVEMFGTKTFILPPGMTIHIDEKNQQVRFVVPFEPSPTHQP